MGWSESSNMAPRKRDYGGYGSHALAVLTVIALGIGAALAAIDCAANAPGDHTIKHPKDDQPRTKSSMKVASAPPPLDNIERHIRVVVLDHNNSPIRGARLLLVTGTTVVAEGETSRVGDLEFRKLAPVLYQVVMIDEHSRVTREWVDMSSRREFSLVLRQDSCVEVELRVVDGVRPVPHAKVLLMSGDAVVGAIPPRDANAGTFVACHDTAIRIEAQGYATREHVALAGRENIILLPEGINLRGTVLGVDGRPCASASVVAKSVIAPSGVSAVAGMDGAFTIAQLGRGYYEVSAKCQDGMQEAVSYILLTAPETDVVLQATRACRSVTLTFLDSFGIPVEGVWVNSMHSDSSGVVVVRCYPCSPGELSSTTHTLESPLLVRGGCEDVSASAIVTGRRPLGISKSDSVRPQSNGEVDVSWISGSVVRPDGSRVAGAYVRSDRGITISDVTGNFRIPVSPTGPVELEATHESEHGSTSLPDGLGDVVILIRPLTPLTVSMRSAESCRGRIQIGVASRENPPRRWFAGTSPATFDLPDATYEIEADCDGYPTDVTEIAVASVARTIELPLPADGAVVGAVKGFPSGALAHCGIGEEVERVSVSGAFLIERVSPGEHLVMCTATVGMLSYIGTADVHVFPLHTATVQVEVAVE